MATTKGHKGSAQQGADTPILFSGKNKTAPDVRKKSVNQANDGTKKQPKNAHTK